MYLLLFNLYVKSSFMKNQKLKTQESSLTQSQNGENYFFSPPKEILMETNVDPNSNRSLLRLDWKLKGDFTKLNLLFFLFLFSGYSFSQKDEIENRSWAALDYGNYSQSSELVERRSAHEKHFTRQDGQVDMYVSSDQINYFENGQWKTILNTITEDVNGNYKYSNLHNDFKSYYPENIQHGVKTILAGHEMFEMKNAKMYFESNGAKVNVQSIQPSSGIATNNLLSYKDIYGNSIDLQITQGGGKRKLDYILKDRTLIDLNASSQFMVFSEEVILPKGWTARVEDEVIIILNQSGKFVCMYDAPLVFDSNNNNPTKSDSDKKNFDFPNFQGHRSEKESEIISDDNIEYELIVNGNLLTILTKVKMSYLLQQDLVYPVFVDPTLTNSIAATSTWWYDYIAPYGPASISTTGAPANSSITNVNLALNVTAAQYFGFGWTSFSSSTYCNSWHVFSLHDEVYPSYNSYQFTCGGNTNYFNCKNPNRSWRTEIWSVDGDDYRARWGYTVTVTYETVTAPTSITGTSTICSGSSTTLTVAGGTANAGSTPITTQWFTGSCGGTSAGTGTSITVSPTSATTYFVRRVGQCSTTACASLTVNVNAPSVAPTSISGLSTICNGSSTTLTAVGGTLGTSANYQWGTGTTIGSNIISGQTAATLTVSPTSATSYWVRIVNTASPCSASTSGPTISISINQPSINPTSISGTNVCLGNSATLTAVGGTLGSGASYQWGTGSVIGSNPISGANSVTLAISPSASTNYWVRIVNGTAPCSATTAGLTSLITVNTPTFTITPTAGSVVWRGTTNTDWTIASNWYAYDGSNYTVATSTPSSSSNVIIPANQGCVAQQPILISGSVDANNVTVETDASLTMSSGTLNVYGNFTILGTGTFASGSGTVNFNGSGTQVVSVGSQVFNNVTINGLGTVQLAGNTIINGNYTNNAGSLDMNNKDLTMGGNYINYVDNNGFSDGLIAGTGSIIFNKASGTQTVFQSVLDFSNIQHTGAGTLELASDISLSGNLTNSAGTLSAWSPSAGLSYNMTVDGDWINNSIFNPGNGFVLFAKPTGIQMVNNGTSTFYRFQKGGLDVGSLSTLSFPSVTEVTENVIIDGSIASNAQFRLTGGNDQVITGSVAQIDVDNLIVNKTGGTVTLSKPVRVNNALTMTQGIIETDATNKLEIGSSTSSLGSVNWTGGTVVGPMRRWFAGAANSTPESGMFPVGLSTVNRQTV